MRVFVTYKIEEDTIKNEVASVATTVLPLKVYGDFPDPQEKVTQQYVIGSGQISNSFEALWLSCKTKVDLIKNEGTRVATRLYVEFSGAQGQIIP